VKKGCSGNERDGGHSYLQATGEGCAVVEIDY
jgi:hypothetical protein